MSIHLKITNESLDLLESEFKLFQNCKVIIDEVPKTQYILMNGLKYFLNEHSNSIKIQISEWSWYQLFSDFIPYINTIHFKHKFICISDFITNYSNENSQKSKMFYCEFYPIPNILQLDFLCFKKLSIGWNIFKNNCLSNYQINLSKEVLSSLTELKIYDEQIRIPSLTSDDLHKFTKYNIDFLRGLSLFTLEFSICKYSSM